MKRKELIVLFLLFIGSLLSPSPVLAQSIDPQYIFVRKTTDMCTPSWTDCSLLWNMNIPNNINKAAVDEVINAIGTSGNSTNTRKVGIGVMFFYNREGYDFNNLKLSLDRLLDLSKTSNVPLFIALDGFQWWGARPDLWNWWNSGGTGYNPNNKNNVEWTCGNSSCAVDKAWRDWFGEIPNPIAPHPNLASSAFISADKERLGQLLPKIALWYNGLPSDKKWLLGGISLGVETDMGGNYYYYPNGIHPNAPVYGITYSAQVGYSAISTLGLSGGVTRDNLNKVIQNYLNQLDKFAFDSGIPRSKIFNHTTWHDDIPGLIFQGPDSATTTYGYPGWSLYFDIAQNPKNFPESSALDKVNNAQWASPEWFPGEVSSIWIPALRNTLNYRNNKFINISNWEDHVRGKQDVLNAIKTVVNESPSCWVTAPQLTNISTSGNSVTFTWAKGTYDHAYILISTTGTFDTTGVFTNKNIAQDVITTLTTYTKIGLAPGKYYWQFIADGCVDAQYHFQARSIDGSFTIAATTPTKTPTPTPFPGDLNGDMYVDLFDYNILIKNWGNPYTVTDFNAVKVNYGK
jgi:hypothetical protein